MIPRQWNQNLWANLLNLGLGLRSAFNWPFVIADVSKAIIGLDFLTLFNLLVDSKNRKVMDRIASLSTVDKSHHNVDPPTLNAINSKSTS
ncbi:hypothetical protein TNCT_217681 [Trichonephila clavata]|uniref:Uncharacterized protein n=1 Tax=Trichonephila clavata TaxID=2740835 RepID=A0A8X6FP50_TRICU|nr:hypothetical protein TNCT_217681 [Trichonephila clavata]